MQIRKRNNRRSTWPARRTQLLVAALIAVSFMIFWYAGDIAGHPLSVQERREVCWNSLPHPARSSGCAGRGSCFPDAALLSDAFLRRRWFLAGLAVACAGTRWPGRSAAVRCTRSSFTPLRDRLLPPALELLILGAMVGGLWNFFWSRLPAPSVWSSPADATRRNRSNRSPKNEPTSLAMALVAQMRFDGGILLIMLVQTDAKKQVLASVFLAGLAGTSIAESYFADRNTARWYWVGPVVVGIVGYFAASFIMQLARQPPARLCDALPHWPGRCRWITPAPECSAHWSATGLPGRGRKCIRKPCPG